MEKKRNVTDGWYVSPYSYADEVRATYDLPEQITIRDVTLSEGQHQPGVNIPWRVCLRLHMLFTK